MSNSSLATYIDTSTRNWSNRTEKITRITVHHAAGNCSMGGYSSILRGSGASWNYAIDSDGTVGLFVDESHRAWTSSSQDNDNKAVTIEVSNSSIGGDWPVSAKAYSSLIKLCVDICKRNNIKKLTYTGKLAGSNLTRHDWFTNKVCPGPYLGSKFPDICAQVNSKLGASSDTPGTLVKSGQFTLRIDTDGASGSYGSGSHQSQTSFEGKYNIKCPADKVPFVVAPLNTTVSGKSTGQLIGCMALVKDNKKNTAVYGLVGDAGPAKNGWGEVSLKCAWDLGYSKSEANGNQGPNSNFSIYIWPSVQPKWKSGTSLESQIKAEGAKLGGADGLTSYDAASGNYFTLEMINHRYIKQYIITIDRNTPVLDYNTLKKNRVVGVIIEAGYLYDVVHSEIYARNPKIDEQCKKASESKMPFGLYWTLKARSIEEAKKELYELSFMIRKYPPVLGMWINLMLSQSESTNNAIIDTYYKEMVRLGLKGKIGFYTTEDQIKKIDWKKYSEDWFLWLNKHVKEISEIDTLLDPQFFVL